jgi:5-oxoprolinase (ATP-hydrolysing)
MTRVFLHPFAGVLSAYGMGLADMRVMREQAVEARLDAGVMDDLKALLGRLEADGRAEMQAQGIDDQHIRVLHRIHLRYDGTDAPLSVDFGAVDDIVGRFEVAHRQRYGFVVPGKAHIVEAVAVEVVGLTETVEDPEVAATGGGTAPLPQPLARVAMVSAGMANETPVYDRAALKPGHRIDGPAIVIEATSTTIVEPGWQAEITARDHVVLTRVVALERVAAIGTKVDPVMLEIFNNLFMSIAEQMGATLENTSYSVNIKERLDFSCALFDQQGQLIANAPHMPVHLGSMSESVRTVIRERGDGMRPGDVYVLNAPYNGGTHLPDITVITPVFDDAGAEILFYVGSRGHHADIGGITPGSMPPDSTTVEEEGVLIDNFTLVDAGHFRETETMELLASGPYPARNPYQNVADLRAQIAANEKGVQELRRMIGHFGLDVVHAYMGHVQDNAEEQVRRVLGVLTDGEFTYPLDDGGEVHVEVTIDKTARSARIDFSGSSDQLPNNFNAPAAVCRAAVLYVFRTLVDDEIPMNEGCLKPLDIVIPAGSMLNPSYPAAVVAGNVETSQVITDTLYGALGVMGASQGTMNNFTFGDDKYQYYETVCGGSGAGPDFDGCDAVHTHMTNSRLTDPEVLEWRFPVLVDSFAIRRGSGGAGRHRGGDGMAGGLPGARGRNHVERADGTVVELGPTDKIELRPGDVFVIETPGGGGFGPPEAGK